MSNWEYMEGQGAMLSSGKLLFECFDGAVGREIIAVRDSHADLLAQVQIFLLHFDKSEDDFTEWLNGIGIAGFRVAAANAKQVTGE